MTTFGDKKGLNQTAISALDPPFLLAKNSTLASSTHHLILQPKWILHHPKAGLNPLVDAAAFLYSFIGNVEKSLINKELNNLYNDFLTELTHFEETLKAQGFNSEYIVVACYALSATLNDKINCLGQKTVNEQWKKLSSANPYNQETNQEDRFFLILERLVKEPERYIDLMEFMYLCLSFGYRGKFYHLNSGKENIDHILDSLYKKIRAHRGEFSKNLAPFPLRKPKLPAKQKSLKQNYLKISLITGLMISMLFLSLRFFNDLTFKQAYKELMLIGNSISYDTTSR